MTRAQAAKTAQSALQDASIIADILQTIASAELSGCRTPIEAASVDWLAKRLDAALEVALEALDRAMPTVASD